MKKITNNLNLLSFFVLSIIFSESIMRICMESDFFSWGFLFTSIFAVSIGTLIFLIISMFKDKIAWGLSLFFCGAISILFISQFIYLKFFRTFYTFYSASNGGQVFEFWKDISSMFIRNIGIVIVFLVPLFVLIIFKDHFYIKKSLKVSYKILSLITVIVFHFLSVSSLKLDGLESNTAYDLYHRSSYPLASFEKLGLLTSMRLDVERTLTNWEPVFEEPIITARKDSKETNISGISFIPPDTSSIDSKNKKTTAQAIEIKKEFPFNIMDIDFDSLILNEPDESMKKMHAYFNGKLPTKQNEYTGMFKNYNLIFLTAESFSPYAVREDLTPTLYKMIHEGFYFKNFYNPIWGASTTDGEYTACTGLIPKSGVWSMYKSANNHLPFVMGNQFKKLGYDTFAYHNHDYNFYRRDLSHPNLGYVYKGRKNGLDVKPTWPESDLEMMEKTVDDYISKDKFHTYYMTVSGHMRYSFKGNTMALKNRPHVDSLELSEEGKAYIAANLELEKSLTYLMDRLKECGKDKNTLIVLSADHYPYGLTDETLTELAGHSIEKNFELYKSPLIIFTPNMKPVEVDKYCSSLDIIPTISNLLGLEYDSRLLAGNDILSDAEPFVVFLNKSYITDKGMYNSETKEFKAFDEFIATEDYLQKYSRMVDAKFYYSTKILDSNYYNILFNQKTGAK